MEVSKCINSSFEAWRPTSVFPARTLESWLWNRWRFPVFWHRLIPAIRLWIRILRKPSSLTVFNTFTIPSLHTKKQFKRCYILGALPLDCFEGILWDLEAGAAVWPEVPAMPQLVLGAGRVELVPSRDAAGLNSISIINLDHVSKVRLRWPSSKQTGILFYLLRTAQS